MVQHLKSGFALSPRNISMAPKSESKLNLLDMLVTCSFLFRVDQSFTICLDVSFYSLSRHKCKVTSWFWHILQSNILSCYSLNCHSIHLVLQTGIFFCIKRNRTLTCLVNKRVRFNCLVMNPHIYLLEVPGRIPSYLPSATSLSCRISHRPPGMIVKNRLTLSQ